MLYDFLLKKLVYPMSVLLYGKLNNLKLIETMKFLEKSQWLNKREIQILQLKKLKRLIDHSYKNVLFYKELFKNNEIKPHDIKTLKDLQKLPVITKEDIRKNFPNNILARNYANSKIIFDSTSGSTGTPFEFIHDLNYAKISGLIVHRNHKWVGFHPGTKYVKLFGEHKESYFDGIINKHIYRRLFLSAFNTSDKSYSSYVQKIRKFKPKVIEAYTSAVIQFAWYLKEHNISNLGIKSIICTAEKLYERDRKFLQDIFDCKCFSKYGSREFASIAHDCEYQNPHINAEAYLVEIVDDDNEVVNGEKGRIIITCLDNYSMPFIRYEIGDIGKLNISDYKCDCGRGLPLFEEIEGRITDFIELPSGKKVSFLLFNYLFEQFGKYIKDFQIVQNKKDTLVVNIVPTKDYHSELDSKIRNDILKYIEEQVEIEVQCKDKIPLEKSGKKMLVKKL
ncbi:MAG: phenylacetate--CoA ligase family protein [Promethearchaeota archaeon]